MLTPQDYGETGGRNRWFSPLLKNAAGPGRAWKIRRELSIWGLMVKYVEYVKSLP
jgi:hypothetical protein